MERTEADSEESIISVGTSGLGTEASSPHVFPSPPSRLSQLKTDKLNRGRQLGEVCQVAPCVLALQHPEPRELAGEREDDDGAGELAHADHQGPLLSLSLTEVKRVKLLSDVRCALGLAGESWA